MEDSLDFAEMSSLPTVLTELAVCCYILFEWGLMSDDKSDLMKSVLKQCVERYRDINPTHFTEIAHGVTNDSWFEGKRPSEK